jgi:hypothetical protein
MGVVGSLYYIAVERAETVGGETIRDEQGRGKRIVEKWT